MQHYRQLLRSKKTSFRFTKAFPVYYDTGNAANPATARVCFYLVFGTQHHKGLYVMNDCTAKAMDAFRREGYAGTLFEQDLPSLDRQHEMAELERAIVQQASSRPITIEDVRLTLMQDTLILLPGGDYRDAVLSLVRKQRLARIDGGKGAITNTTRLRVVA